MKKLYTLLAIVCLTLSITAQNGGTIYQTSRAQGGDSNFNPDFAPFYHGVASGDPLEDRVIIWTRVTPEEMNEAAIEVSWKVATDVAMENVVREGMLMTDATVDYTVKIDVDGLSAGTTYYYSFTAMGRNSLTGRTKTTPTGDQADHLKFGVVSCSNFQAGYFNGYGRLADQNDLDAVIHLGDYIYENGNFSYGDSSLWNDRLVEPGTEIVTEEEYRMRYGTYRLDTNLIRVHQQHPFITVWDDHESTNDSYKDGAQNHQPETEGDWETRKEVSKKVYFEWLPIRDNETRSVFRNISYGDLVDLIMLDTRLEGREVQINNALDSVLLDSARTLLGEEQKAWLFEQLSNSTAKWKVIGQQVIFSELNVGWASLLDPNQSYFEAESIFLDIWDGYPAERTQVVDYIKDNEIDNVVILTGDFHTTFAFDVADPPMNLVLSNIPGIGEIPSFTPSDYDPATGANAVAVEFAVPSITSANFDENLDVPTALLFQATINNNVVDPGTGLSFGNPNPHMKYTDFIQHGFYILDIKADSVQADYYFTPINEPTDSVANGQSWYTMAGVSNLQQAAAASAPKATQDAPAPLSPQGNPTTNIDEVEDDAKFAILGVYPNPFATQNTLFFSLADRAQVNIDLFDAAGKLVKNVVRENMPAGTYNVVLDASDLQNGNYLYQIKVDNKVYTTRVVVAK